MEEINEELSGSQVYDHPGEDQQYGLTEDVEAVPVEVESQEEKEEEKPAPKEDDAYAERYANLEKVFSKQGQEVGQLRKANQDMAAKLAGMEQAINSSKNTVTPSDYDAKVNEIAAALEVGDISLSDGMKQLAFLSREAGKTEAESYYSQVSQKKEQEQAVKQFKQSNPDFDEVVASGVLDQYKQSNPLHDNFSAYYAFKVDDAARQIEEQKKQAFTEGAKTTEKLRKGAEVTKTVLSKPGANAKQVPQQNKAYSDQDRLNSMASVLAKLRGGT